MTTSERIFELKEDMRRALEKMGLWPLLSTVFIDQGPNSYIVFSAGSTLNAIARVYQQWVDRAIFDANGKLLKHTLTSGFRVSPCDHDGKIDPEDGAQISMDCLDSRTVLSACMGMLVNYAYDMIVPPADPLNQHPMPEADEDCPG